MDNVIIRQNAANGVENTGGRNEEEFTYDILNRLSSAKGTWKNEVADEIEEYESRAAVSVVLENRLKEVRDAHIRIENNKYGICDISGQNIEEDRLEANPAARTCKKYMETN